MSSHGQRQQKKLAKKKAKRAEKRAHLSQQVNLGVVSLFRKAADWPVIEAMMPDVLWDQGLGNVVIARKLPDGRIAFAAFLVDVYCLGVKNAMFDILVPSDYRHLVAKIDQATPLHSISPESAAKLVIEAVAYARNLGFSPHPDYETARLLFAGIDPSQSTSHFEFGKDGKPLYVQGPNESPGRARRIVERVREAGGEYIVAAQTMIEDFDELEIEAEQYRLD